MNGPLVIALLGAESTGKTTLTQTLASHLQGRGLNAEVVPEALREFCDRHGRTPLVHEQFDLAREQTRRIALARTRSQIVLADTTALMTAVYSELIFQDRSLYAEAIQAHRMVTLTLLTALDLPWQADGMQRDGEHVRLPVDVLIRQTLAAGGLAHSVVSGQGDARHSAAMAAVDHALAVEQAKAAGRPRTSWRWICEKCDDGDCEQHWLPGA